MSERRPGSESPPGPTSSAEVPPPDAAAFIRYCYRRRGVGWPELYDEMCGVASRREFNGWDHAELAARGIAFSLLDMARLAAWTRSVIAAEGVQQRHDAVPPPAPVTAATVGGHSAEAAIAQ